LKRDTEVVLSYVPTVLAELVSKGGDSPPWGDMVEGTLVMADVSGFTTMSERLAEAGQEGAERLTGIINGFFGGHLESAREFGGDTLTFGGDAILLPSCSPRRNACPLSRCPEDR
jgi:class 3 adenylate cyclase